MAEADPTRLTAAGLAQAFAAKMLSPVESLSAILARIEALNPHLHAYFHIDAEGAMEAAKASEARWMRGEQIGPLDGAPFSVKDHVLTRGMPSVWGVKGIDGDGPWTVDAPAVARLREAGAILVGKTSQPDFAMLCSGVSSRYAAARNPWDLTKSPGGSSSGAAAAIAACLGPIAIGSDGGGSIRLPAAYCGVVGHKPTFGQAPLFPPMGPGPVYGPMTRTVDDAALVMNAITKPDWRDVDALPRDNCDYEAAIRGGVRGMRVAYSENFGFGSPVSDEVSEQMRGARTLLEDLGVEIEEIPPFFDFDLYDALAPKNFPAFALIFSSFVKNLDGTLPEIRNVLEKGIEAAAAPGAFATALAATARETDARLKIAEKLEPFDALITPTTPTTAYEADLCFPKGSKLNRFGYCFDHNPFTWPFNVTLQPATSIPVGLGRNSRLPVGMQIVGKRGADALCLRIAHAFLQAAPVLPEPRWLEETRPA